MTGVLKRSVWTAALLASLGAGHVQAKPADNPSDTVSFKNGDRLSGSLEGADNKVVRLRTVALGELAIAWPEIAQVEAKSRTWKLEGADRSTPTNSAVVLLRNVGDSVVISADGRTTTASKDSSVVFLVSENLSASAAVEQGAKKPVQQSSSSVSIGLNAPESVVLGTQSQINLGGNLKVLHNEPNLCAAPAWFSGLRAAVTHNKNYKVGSPAIVTDTFDGELSTKNGLGTDGGTSGVLVADYYGNSSLGVSLQQSYGGGLSRALYNNSCKGTKFEPPNKSRFKINGEATLRYIRQRLYAPGGTENLAGLRLNEDLLYEFVRNSHGESKTLFRIDQSLWVTPMFNDARAVQAGGSVSFGIPVWKTMTIGITEDEYFINNAPKARRKNYLKSALTVTYTFPAAN